MEGAACDKEGRGKGFVHILNNIDGFWNDAEIELKHFH